MKLVIATIQPHRLSDVKKALFDANIRKMTVSTVLGCGQQGGYQETFRGSVVDVQLLKKVRVEIALNDEFVDKAVSAIIAGAKTDRIGDGKIFILPLEGVIRIRTEEQGKEAIG